MTKKKEEPNKPRIYKQGTVPKPGDLCWACITAELCSRPIPLIAPCIIDSVYIKDGHVLVRYLEASNDLYPNVKLDECQREVVPLDRLFSTRTLAYSWLDNELWNNSNKNVANILSALIRKSNSHPIIPLLLEFLKEQTS